MPYWQLYYHVVWATRGREPLITPLLEPRVYNGIRAAADRHGVVVHALGGVKDHVHAAVSIPPRIAVATAIGKIKGASAHFVNLQQAGSFGWQDEYSALSFSRRDLSTVVRYVTNQKQHHAEGRLHPALEQIEPTK